MSSRSVTLSIRSVQTLDDGQAASPVETAARALLRQEGEELVLTYEEGADSGMAGVRTTLRIAPGQITLLRKGPWRCRMVFQEGETHEGLYETPYGALPMRLYTRRLRAQLGEAGGELELEYDMELAGQSAGTTQFRLTVREEAPDSCQ